MNYFIKRNDVYELSIKIYKFNKYSGHTLSPLHSMNTRLIFTLSKCVL